jgi:hypothetical protein
MKILTESHNRKVQCVSHMTTVQPFLSFVITVNHSGHEQKFEPWRYPDRRIQLTRGP